MMNLFFGKEGTKIVCGGTTSNVVSRYLGQPIIASLDYHDPDVPPSAASRASISPPRA